MKLQDQVAVITGAGSGMGEASALLFAQEGAKVVAVDLNEDTAKAVVEKIQAAGGNAIAVKANVANEDDVQNMIDAAVKQYGTVDILFNNAGVMDNFVPAHNVTDELWERVINVNLTAVMRATRKVLPIFMEKESGVIINNTSSGGLYGSRSGAAYTASKHAVTGYTKNVGFMYAEKGIRCNAIAPGGVDTNINTSINDPDEFGMSRVMSGANNTPRTGKPEEIATIALFLAAEDSGFVNGVTIEADGGWTAY